MSKSRFRDVKHGKISPKPSPSARTSLGAKLFPNKRTRAKAFITDGFMLMMPIMYVVFYFVMEGREGFAANKLLGWVYILVPLVFVQIVFLAKSNQTPGMRAYDIRLVDARTLAPPTFGQIVLRQIIAPLSRLGFGWIFLYLRADHRQPHELLSRTALIITDNPHHVQSAA